MVLISYGMVRSHSEHFHVLQLLGFPIQLFGLLLLPSTIVKYLVEKDDPTEDVRSGLV